jgi:hypothetical protein
MAKKKKSSTKPALSATLFKLTGASAKLKTNDKKKKLYYFKQKVAPDKAEKLAADTAAEVLEAPKETVKLGKPSLKHDFYCIYDAEVAMKYLSVRNQEIGVYDQLMGAMVGNQVVIPKKGKDIPGKAIFVDIVEMYETKNTASHILDGTTGFPAKTLETLLRGAGKSTATSAWIAKAKVSLGKFNSIEKVVKAISADASKAPKDAKRIVEHTLSFKELSGFYVPTYYVTASVDSKSKILRINAVNGNVALKV